MARYKIRDCFLSDVLGRDYFLPEDRNYAEDTFGGIRVVFHDAQANRLFVEVDHREAVGFIDFVDGWGEAYISIPPPPLPIMVFTLSNMALGLGSLSPLITIGSVVGYNELRKLVKI